MLQEGKIAPKILFEKIDNLSILKPIILDSLSSLESNYNEEIDKTIISTCICKIDELNAAFRKGTVNAVMGYIVSYKTMIVQIIRMEL